MELMQLNAHEQKMNAAQNANPTDTDYMQEELVKFALNEDQTKFFKYKQRTEKNNKSNDFIEI